MPRGHIETFVRPGDNRFVLVGAQVERTRTGDHTAIHVTLNILEATVIKLQAMGSECIRAPDNSALYFFYYNNPVFELETHDLEKITRHIKWVNALLRGILMVRLDALK